MPPLRTPTAAQGSATRSSTRSFPRMPGGTPCEFECPRGTRWPATVAHDKSIREQSRSPHEEPSMLCERTTWSVLSALILSLFLAPVRADEYDRLKVGVQPD